MPPSLQSVPSSAIKRLLLSLRLVWNLDRRTVTIQAVLIGCVTVLNSFILIIPSLLGGINEYYLLLNKVMSIFLMTTVQWFVTVAAFQILRSTEENGQLRIREVILIVWTQLGRYIRAGLRRFWYIYSKAALFFIVILAVYFLLAIGFALLKVPQEIGLGVASGLALLALLYVLYLVMVRMIATTFYYISLITNPNNSPKQAVDDSVRVSKGHLWQILGNLTLVGAGFYLLLIVINLLLRGISILLGLRVSTWTQVLGMVSPQDMGTMTGDWPTFLIEQIFAILVSYITILATAFFLYLLYKHLCSKVAALTD